MKLTPEQRAQKQLKKILDYAFPLTEEIRTCRQKRDKWNAQRDELTKLVEAYRAGTEVKQSPLTLKVDLTKIREMINN